MAISLLLNLGFNKGSPSVARSVRRYFLLTPIKPEVCPCFFRKCTLRVNAHDRDRVGTKPSLPRWER